jgi:hypothetical protein
LKAKTTEFLKTKSNNLELWYCWPFKNSRMTQISSKNERITEDKDDKKFEGMYDRTLRSRGVER